MKAPCSLVLTPWLYQYHIGILFLRVAVSVMMLTHGIPKMLMLWQGQGPAWMNPLGLGATASLFLCAFAECVCSITLMLGFLSRLSALVLVFNFWVVVFVFDRDAAWAQVELPLLYLVCYGTLLCTGGGAFSLDRLFSRKLRTPDERANAGAGSLPPAPR